jgi:hypothetical protein
VDAAVQVALIGASAGLVGGAVTGVVALALGWFKNRAERVDKEEADEQRRTELVAAQAREDLLAERAAAAAKAAKDAADAVIAAKQSLDDAKAEIVAATKDGAIVIGKQLDGRLSELLREARMLARAEGKAEGIIVGKAQGEQAQRDRTAAPQP